MRNLPYTFVDTQLVVVIDVCLSLFKLLNLVTEESFYSDVIMRYKYDLELECEFMRIFELRFVGVLVCLNLD